MIHRRQGNRNQRHKPNIDKHKLQSHELRFDQNHDLKKNSLKWINSEKQVGFVNVINSTIFHASIGPGHQDTENH